ncbi:MAG: phenylalanine--tRNA ligase subunit beta [Ignavibacteria bacterium]|nr:phenylalanine--tRNA ligase subunit beta [Ignavibacteria bacterium]
MKISLNWIKEYIPGFQYDSLESLTDKMIAIGLDIESIEDESVKFNNFVIGEVLEKDKHPNADKLSVCKVNSGEEILNIVCGAPNVEKGQKVCVAKIGAVIPDGEFEIKKSKIRGEISEGMICSSKELNLSDDHDGIMVLQTDAKNGTPFAEISGMNDVVFDIGITPNRGDLFSHFGIAREIAAIYGKKIKFPGTDLKESAEKTEELITIEIENTDLCKRFTGRVIKDVIIRESPDWLKKKLISIGLRPRNNIVDITNYIMMETGQPLHAFDYDKIRGKKIIVRTANEGDSFTTLDSKERKLNSASLMICDGEGYSGIAGVMGGEFSEITNETKNVFLESAYFDPVSIRKNSKRLGLQTDASQRFERGVDIDIVKYASERASDLISEIANGNISAGLYDLYPEKLTALEAGVRVSKASELLGIILTKEQIIELLGKIELNFLREDSEILYFQIPEFRRQDIIREADLIEEIARLYGYDNIPAKYNFNVNTENSSLIDDKDHRLMRSINDYLTGRGFNQILTSPMTDGNSVNIINNGDSAGVKIENTVSAEMNTLRTGLLPGMLGVIKSNFNNSGKDISLKFFETGKVYSDKGGEFIEETKLIMALSGKRDIPAIYGNDDEFNFFDIKGEAEMLLFNLNLDESELNYHYNKSIDSVRIDISLNNYNIAAIYKADNKHKKEFEIDSDVFIAEFCLNKILKNFFRKILYKEISKFPKVKRDLAVLIDRDLPYNIVNDQILKSGKGLLSRLELFDIYSGDKIEEGKKSLAFSMEFSSEEKTLTDIEISAAMDKVIQDLKTKLNAVIRSQ